MPILFLGYIETYEIYTKNAIGLVMVSQEICLSTV